MKRLIALLLVIFTFTGCFAGFNVCHVSTPESIQGDSHIIIFPFRDPSLNGTEFSGVGGRFTRAFSQATANYDITLLPVSSNEFCSDKDIDIVKALEYARRYGAKYIVTGYVTKWVDRATEWSAKRDFAGLNVTMRETATGKIIGSAEMNQHSSIFWSGTPDDYTSTLSDKMALKLFGPVDR
jgi:Domain of unknown function (DUF4823)